jgi:RND family efflux transporter MFP subunit
MEAWLLSQSAIDFPVMEICAALLAELELAPRARALARGIAEFLPESAVVVFALAGDDPQFWVAKASVGDISVDPEPIAVDAGTLGAVREEGAILQFRTGDLPREQYAHLDVRQRIAGLSYLPLQLSERLIGCVEIVSLSDLPDEATLEGLSQVAAVGALALAGGLTYAAERDAALASVMRLTQLYDIEKVFAASLEMETLLPIICEKVGDLIHATTANLWMVDQEDLLLMQQEGRDPVYNTGERQSAGGGIAGGVGESGEGVLLQAEDAALVARNENAAGSRAGSVIAAPVIDGENLVGVLEMVRVEGESPFTDDDLFVLTQVAASAAQALHNSSLLQAERKIEVLHTLVSVGQEIGSTLNQERVLQAIVDQPQLVIPYERAAIALEQRGRLAIQAVSGITKLDTSEPSIAKLQEILRWVGGVDTEVHVVQRGDEIDEPRPETREKFRRYFEATGSRGFFAVPLADEEGHLGVLSFESPDADFLTDLHLEVIRILSSQATLALRNASLYKEVPFIGILEPLMEKRRRFMALDRGRRWLRVGVVAAVLIVLVAVPVPMRISGVAVVAPSQTQSVRATEDGVVRTVLVREGQHVTPGTPLFNMADWGQQSALASAQAHYNTAMAEMARSLVGNDAAAAGRRELEAEYLRGEVQRASERLDRMTVRAQIDGIVSTPHPENLDGRKVSAGDAILDLIDTRSSAIDVAIPQSEVALLQAGDGATVKLESWPARTFRGAVDVISPAAELEGENRVFYARLNVPNSDGALRPGMQGFSKISAGSRPLGYVLFRGVAVWAWDKLWDWFGW